LKHVNLFKIYLIIYIISTDSNIEEKNTFGSSTRSTAGSKNLITLWV